MKRSEINNYLRWAVDLMDKYQFKLPRFAYWSMDEGKDNKDKIETWRKDMQGREKARDFPAITMQVKLRILSTVAAV